MIRGGEVLNIGMKSLVRFAENTLRLAHGIGFRIQVNLLLRAGC